MVTCFPVAGCFRQVRLHDENLSTTQSFGSSTECFRSALSAILFLPLRPHPRRLLHPVSVSVQVKLSDKSKMGLIQASESLLHDSFSCCYQLTASTPLPNLFLGGGVFYDTRNVFWALPFSSNGGKHLPSSGILKLNLPELSKCVAFPAGG